MTRIAPAPWFVSICAVAALAAPESGILRTNVGTGEAGYSGDGGPAAKAALNQPFHCSQDRAGNLFIADALNYCIRRVDAATGTISTVAGCGRKGYSGDGGPATAAMLNEPYGVLPDRDGNVFIVDRLNAVIRRVDARTHVITTYAGDGEKGFGGDGGSATKAMFKEPNALDFDPEGNLYIADVADNRIRRVDVHTQVISTVAGTGRNEFTGDGGPASAAGLEGARGVAFDHVGNMYVCEREGNRIRRADRATGIIRTFAGTGEKGYAGDGGPALQATFNGPKWVHVGPDGNVYVVDTENHCVRRIDIRTNVITTVVGGHRGADGDGGPANQAGLDRPHGCWLDERGVLFVADTDNNRVRSCLLFEHCGRNCPRQSRSFLQADARPAPSSLPIENHEIQDDFRRFDRLAFGRLSLGRARGALR